ncbi:MAG: ATP-binding protein [Nitrospirae bacterium]|nr:ATP-binding protein [Nitrospirota bacterium]
MRSTIYKREVIDEIGKYLRTGDIIVLHGARQVGKTSILRYIEAELKAKGETVYFIDLEDSRYVKILDAGVVEFLKHLEEEGIKAARPKKKVFVFIDEIQYLANPSSFLKLIADHHKGIKLIVSGSSSFAIKSKFKDSLVVRTVDFDIFNLSFREFLTFRGYAFKESKTYTAGKVDELRGLFKQYVLYGGYPKIVLTPEAGMKEKYLQQIIDTYVKKDIRDLASIKDIEKFNKLLEALAGQSGQVLNIAELSNTTRIAKQTIEKYLFIMENTYILKLLRPYSGNIRSELFKLPKIFFYDTGIMQMLWLKGLQKELIGSVFETGIFAELVKKYDKDSVYYWRTKDGKEIDFILRIKKSLLPVEVKLNFEQFRPTAVNYFNEKYSLKKYKVAGLDGKRKNEFQVYPWEL